MVSKLFGTDGIRNRAGYFPINRQGMIKLSNALWHLLKDCISRRIVIGKDSRISSDTLEASLVTELNARGIDVMLLQHVPTATVSFAVKKLHADLGLMISASHNPYTDNGIKIFDKQGNKLSIVEEYIIEDYMTRDSFVPATNKIGRIHDVSNLQEQYIEFIRNTLPKTHNLTDLKGIKIVLDCANGSAYKIAKAVFAELNCITIFDKPDGYNINTNCGAVHTYNLQQSVLRNNADIGIALDGDADRIALCDEKGKMLNGDAILAILSSYFLPVKVVGTVMTSMALENYLRTLNITLLRAKVGDRSVFTTMKKNNCPLGGEPSGHIIFNKYTNTSDALIAAIQILYIMHECSKKTSELFSSFIAMPQILSSVQTTDLSSNNMEQIIHVVEKELGKNGRLVVRKSGTEPCIRILLEGNNKKQIEQLAEYMISAIKGISNSVFTSEK